MSSYKVIDSTISLLYCARCANEFLEVVPPDRIVCSDCGMVYTIDPKLVRVGQIKGTKYKMRDSKRYSFRELVDEGREDAFKEVFVPSPDGGKGQVGWRNRQRAEETGAKDDHTNGGDTTGEPVEIRAAGVDDQAKGWRSDALMETIADAADQADTQQGARPNGRRNQ